MFNAISKLTGSKWARRAPAIPFGERVYAIGDIHGRSDLFAAIVTAIESDDLARPPATTNVIVLGDLIDRGPDSAGVIGLARQWQRNRNVRFVYGNHEEMFLQSLYDSAVLRQYLRFGGDKTLLSYCVDHAAVFNTDIEMVQQLVREAVPRVDLEFIQTFEDYVAIGDYLFVHAGIRPGVPLARQQVKDLRWIREPFLSDPGNLDHVVVHGHSITARPDITHNRIGIDTGAFQSGMLTAVRLEGTECCFIEAKEFNGEIVVSTRPAQIAEQVELC